MATLTYDPTPADQPEFTPEEQDSIAVGEQLEQQENQLLAGKYENAQELEKAYVELQRKLGGQSEDEESDVPEEAEQETEEETEEVEETEEETQVTMTAEDIQTLKNLVGGDEAYGEMIAWASDNMTEQEQQAYDYVMDLDDPWAAFFAVKALQNSYNNANGYEGELLTGKSPSNPVDVFRSQAEVVEAMSDPRYDNDPAYRNDVFEKLDRSNLQF
tara:strand:+ start:61 stop:708 length:648 start_codon:yes stop_codon:yes gene_type:complete